MLVSEDFSRSERIGHEAPLAQILRPMCATDFMNEYWSRCPLHRSGQPGRFSHLLRSGDIEFLVTSLVTLQPGWISFTRDGAQLPISSIIANNGFITANGFRQAWASGFTVQLPSLQRRWPTLSMLCRALEAELMSLGVAISRPILANAYATPPGTRGLKPHHDDHEVLVFQLEGQKRWRIFQPTVLSPLKSSAEPIAEEHLGAPVSEVLMAPGDILYIPRGFPHDASAVAGAALHVTFSIGCNTWLDLALSLLSQHAAFRANLSPVTGGSVQQGRLWSEALPKLLEEVRIGADETAIIASQLRDNFVSAIQPALQAVVEDLSTPREITLGTIVSIRPGSFIQFDKRSGNVVLLYAGGVYERAPAYEPAFQYIAEHRSFAIRDVPGLIDQAKISLFGDLIGRGCLVAPVKSD